MLREKDFFFRIIRFKLRRLINSVILLRNIYKLKELAKWSNKYLFSFPIPPSVKESTLLRHGIKDSIWIETGTFMGRTTAFLASKFPLVHTIEPSNYCLKIARINLNNFKNIIFHEGTSEECLQVILNDINKDVCFWLDGHFSGGISFEAETFTPIKNELATIERNLKNFKSVVICIDDISSSLIDKEHYPPLEFYVEWASRNNFSWIIEHNIFILKSKDLNFFGNN